MAKKKPPLELTPSPGAPPQDPLPPPQASKPKDKDQRADLTPKSPEESALPSEAHPELRRPEVDQVAPEFSAKLVLARWWSTPTSLRVPQTKTELAKELGVDRKTLWAWEQSPDLWDAVQEMRGALWGEHLPDVIQALVTAAKEGERWAVELYLEAAGVIVKVGKGGKLPAGAQGGGSPQGGALQGLEPGDLRGAQDRLLRGMGLVPVAPDFRGGEDQEGGQG